MKNSDEWREGKGEEQWRAGCKSGEIEILREAQDDSAAGSIAAPPA